MTNELGGIIAEAIKRGPPPKHYRCSYCNKEYSRESSLLAHTCEPKRRIDQQNDVGVRIGYNSWLLFYKITQPHVVKTAYTDFCKSNFYKAFVKFGWHLHAIRAVSPPSFAEWLIKNNKKLDYWCKDALYVEYLLQYLPREKPMDALERTILELQDWSDAKGIDINLFFSKVAPPLAIQMITNGRISPWVIYCSDSGMDFISRLSTEQLDMIWPWIDPSVWNNKLNMHVADVELCKGILSQSGF